ncbi:MAG: hypothetical protein MZW92_69975 [Comamonadaceae bacterium]|nr:hypothetical protein [Comamonadaceae bacterium]
MLRFADTQPLLAADLERALSRMRVLYVDDDRDQHPALRRDLPLRRRRRGRDCAATGAEALEPGAGLAARPRWSSTCTCPTPTATSCCPRCAGRLARAGCRPSCAPPTSPSRRSPSRRVAAGFDGCWTKPVPPAERCCADLGLDGGAPA